MPNPFDQFDPSPQPSQAPVQAQPTTAKTQGNPFDQFDEHPMATHALPATVSSAIVASDPHASMLQNIGPSAMNLLNNMADTVRHPIRTAKALGGIAVGAPLVLGERIGAALAGQDLTPELQAQIAAKHPILGAVAVPANALNAAYKDRYGNLRSIERTIQTDPVGAAADLATLAAAPVGALRAVRATGAADAAMNVSRAVNPLDKSNLVARAANAATDVIPGAKGVKAAIAQSPRAVVNALNPRAKIVLNALEGRGPAVAAAVDRPDLELVPGSVPTVGEAAADTGATKLQALNATALQRLSSEANELNETRNAARINEVRQIGTTHAITPEQLQRAGLAANFNPGGASIDELVDALHSADANNYGAVDHAMIPTDQGWRDLNERPVMQSVVQRAQTSAANAQRPFMIGQDVPAHQVPSSVMGPNGHPVMINVPEQTAQIPGNNLSFIKKAFDDETSQRVKDYGAGSAEVRDTQNAKQAFLNWLEDPSRLPEHAQARADSTAWRNLIARKRGAQVFEDALTKKLEGEDTVNQRAAAFGNLFDNPDLDLQRNPKLAKVTGLGNLRQWSDVLTPEDLAHAEAVRQDLARTAKASDQAKMAALHKSVLGNTSSPGGNYFSPSGLAYRGVNSLKEFFMHKVYDDVAHGMLTPQGGLQMIQNALAHQDYWNQVGQNVSKGASKAIKYPAAYNALAAARNQQKNSLSR